MEWVNMVKFDAKMVLDDSSTTDVAQLASEYWYNIAILSLLIVVCYIGCFIIIAFGWKKNWHKFSDFHIDHVTTWHYFKDWRISFIYRVIIIAFCVFIWFWTWLYQTVHKKDEGVYDFMSYYTVWNFTMLIAYFFVRFLSNYYPNFISYNSIAINSLMIHYDYKYNVNNKK